jgi:sialate O-acetylesterase
MCEAQLQASAIPNSAMVVINDLHDNYDQHPRCKQGVGERLALAARSVVYGEKKLNYHGPLYRAMKVEGHRVRLEFAHADGGLVAKDPQALSGFTIAGEDRKFQPAQAVIDGNTIIVQSEPVTKPAAVRYNWGNPNPVCALFNRDQLPLSAFRTDDWPLP